MIWLKNLRSNVESFVEGNSEITLLLRAQNRNTEKKVGDTAILTERDTEIVR